MRSKLFQITAWSILLIIIDQITKFLVYEYNFGTINILGDFFRIEYSQNTGVAFGIPIPYAILIVGNILLIGLIIWIIRQEFDLNHPMGKIGLILIISGAFGNIIDRLIHGFVIDFIAIWGWPNFNFADMYISVGILIMIVFYGKIRRTQK